MPSADLSFMSAALGIGHEWLAPAIIAVVGLATALLGYGIEPQRHRFRQAVEWSLSVSLPV